MDYKSIEKRLVAANTIFQSHEINKATLDNLQIILKGIHPNIDRLVGSVVKVYKPIDSIQKGDVLQLTVEAIPELTEKDKKRKKTIVFFIKCWNDLKSEVARVQKEFEKNDGNIKQNTMDKLGNVMGLAKGPFGIITIIAAGIVLLKVTEVSIVIRNNGCDPMNPKTGVSINIPGLKLPNSTIAPGGEAVAKLPSLSVSVDATSLSTVRLSMYGVKYDVPMESSRATLVFDGAILNGQNTTINLGSQKTHILEVQCR